MFNAEVLDVTDGDTLLCRVDRGMRDYSTWSVRVLGINCWGRETEAGAAAREYVRSILPVGSLVILHTVKPDKFGGRVLADVRYPGGSLAGHLVLSGWAAPWAGRGERPYPAWPRV